MALTMTMTMTTWNLTRGQRSKWSFCAQISWSNQSFTILTTENLYLGHGHDENGYFCG